MTRAEKIQATKADARYGEGKWVWADYAGPNETRVLIHSANCRCEDCEGDYDY